MLLNFCDPSLRTEVKCSTVSTEGYEVENLVNNSENGFMIYSCIKPPVHVDFHFVCNIRISHIIIWPSIGAQKSSGFQILAKSSDEINTLYTTISNGYLKSVHSGILFYRSGIDPTKIYSPLNFLQCRMKSSESRLINYTSKLRISVVKTDNSVPALGKVEIWGNVSPQCGKDVVASICSLWSQRNICESVFVDKSEIPSKSDINTEIKVSQSLDVPENFLDPITWEIMIQPIVLPSGKVIDQSTLEKHEQNEAIWGRPSSDPFTGLPLSEARRALAATALKVQIDKFLLENSEAEEVKKLPRVLGTKSRPESSLKLISKQNTLIGKLPVNIQSLTKYRPTSEVNSNRRKKLHCHALPVAPVKRCRNVAISKPGIMRKESLKIPESSCGPSSLHLSSEVKYPETNCDCCKNSNFYKLPCKHIVCRKILLSSNNQCGVCKSVYESSDPERVYTLLNLKNGTNCT